MQSVILDAVALLPPTMQTRKRDFYTFVAVFPAIAASGVQSQDIKVSDDADFVAVYGNIVVSNAANTTFYDPAPFTVTMLDSGSGRQNMSAAVMVSSLFGTAQRPGIFPQPKILARASTYTLTMTNLDAGAAYNVRVALVGFKVFGEQA